MSLCQRRVTRLQPRGCHNDAEDYPLCFECVKLLGSLVKSLKEYADELETQITRQDRGAPTVGGGSGEPKLAYDHDASQARDGLEIILAHWFAASTDPEAHAKLQGHTQERRIDILLAWFRHHCVYLGRSAGGPEILADLDQALNQAQRAVDRKNTKVWIGNCGCGKPVMAFPKQQATVQCECGAEYDPQGSRRDLRVLGGQQVVTIRQAQKLGEVWGRKINPSTVRSWHRRQQLECQGDCVEEGHIHTYLMSDLLTLHKEK